MPRRPPCCLSWTDEQAMFPPVALASARGGSTTYRKNLFSARCAFFAINKLILCWKR